MAKTTIRDRIKSLRRVKASELKPNPRNWRKHPQAQRDALRGVLAEIGYAGALLARELPDKTLELVDGHLRADLDPDAKVPVLILDISEAEAAKLLTVFDPLGAMATADTEVLGKLLAEIDTESEGLEQMLKGLADEHGLDVFGGNDEVLEVEPQIDRAVELQKKWGTELGQLWVIPSKTVEGGEHRVLCGDSTKAEDVDRVMGGTKADLVTADPPYGVKYTGGSGKVWDAFRNDPKAPMAYAAFVCDILKCGRLVSGEDAALYLWFSDSQMGSIDFAVRSAGWFRRCLVLWVKDRFTFSRAITHYRQQHEPCLYAGASKSLPAWYGPNNEATTWEIPKPQAHDAHPTQKPTEVYVRMLRNSTAVGASVLELCLGSGTTMVAAEQLGRLCYGLEIEPEYVAVTLERMTDLGLKPKLLKGNS